ncbi:MAG: hypothetical protein NTY35_04905 [Planctomycetota bacterium]|nr:hypothetical protein [Planctomycetota bacterium]
MTQNWQRRTVAALAFVGAAAFSEVASAQCSPTTTTNGPDVIVGDLTGPSNYTAVGNIEALSIGTTSCNIGNVWLNWISNNNQHPVIGQTLYRLKFVDGAGRFEQVGQSWLKHGFFALSEGLCCSGCVATDGSHLGVHCSDPYTSGRNGSQSGLGPKWQVNASTGAFTYPPANPAWSGSVARRVQVKTSELEVTTGSSTKYFGTGQYVTPDDALAGNNNNNESWRGVTVSGSGSAWNFAFTGITQRAQYALKAWQANEAGVTLNEIQVPGDGLLIVGFKSTSIAGGLYRYEYAVQNLNNDRSVRSFSIPVGAGVTVTNIGFHDVDYHSGDGVGNVTTDGTDWAGVLGGSDVTWSTQTFAQNSNANALRWGTTYNFRFDANAAPISGLATLGHFKIAGTSTTTVDVPGTGTGPAAYAFCFGDGSGTACPCANNSPVGNNEGCLNSLGTGGSLTVSGASSVGADTFSLVGNGMPDSSALYFQGTTQQAGGAGAAFGDGLRCAAGTVIRLGTKVNSLGTSQYPQVGDQSVSVRGTVAAGDVRTYQIWYRNAAAFCTASTFNVSNGYQAVWTP